MALEAVVYQQQDLFSQNNNPNNNNDGKFDLLYPLLLENCVSSSSSSFDYLLEHQSSSDHQFIDDWNYDYNYNYNLNYDSNYNHNYDYDCNYPSVVNNAAPMEDYQQWRPEQNSSSPEMEDSGDGDGGIPPPAVVERPKRRRRVRTKKNEEEIENQRMTHIAVERNRRKQMNDYLSALRSLMPNSYVQRGDQASIIGGAINFVKELEQNLQCLSAKKQANEYPNNNTCGSNSSSSSLPFGEFFSFPQYSGTTSGGGSDDPSATSHRVGGGGVAADVEVTMVESHALLKIRTKRPLKQLSKLVIGLQGLRLCILHLNVSKVDGVAFYSFSLKVEDDESKLSSVDEIAGAVYQLLGRIQEEASIYF